MWSRPGKKDWMRNLFINTKGWFSYSRPGRPSRPSRSKKCADDCDDYMRTLLRRPGTTASDPDDWDDRGRLDRTEFYPDDRDDRERSETIIWELLSGDRDDWDDPSDPNLSQNALLFPSIRNDSDDWDDRDDYMRTSLKGTQLNNMIDYNGTLISARTSGLSRRRG